MCTTVVYDASSPYGFLPDKQIYFIVLPSANSSSAIEVISTEHGIILQSNVTYYHEDLRVGWLQKYVISTVLVSVCDILFWHICGALLVRTAG